MLDPQIGSNQREGGRHKPGKMKSARRFPVLSNEKRRAGRQLITSGLLLVGNFDNPASPKKFRRI